MDRQILWAPADGPGLEHLSLKQQNDEIIADGLIIGLQDNRPFRVRYIIQCDQHWRVRQARVEWFSAHKTLSLHTDGAGHWKNAGTPALAFYGCLDVDISATPFTNTLPIRRLALKPGESAEISVVYIAVPHLQIKPVQQRYTCLDLTPDGGRYRYEGLSSGFTTEITVDADGLVIDYPGIWRRV